ncbi:MAG: putative Excalibur domain protein [Nitrosopumilales archaeon]|nr:MAG: putative Excalibur domain protein [Nitrosopumilales archaeon]
MGKWVKLGLPIIAVAILSITVVSTVEAQGKYSIPSWVKGIAGFWAEDKISDQEFGEGLTFLIDNQVIKVPLIQELIDENTQLKQENAELKAKLDLGIDKYSLYPEDSEYLDNGCPVGYPYIWSDGYCYDQPESTSYECPTGYPYEWSDGLCYNEPEFYDNGCPNGYPYLWSDGLCYTIPEIIYDEPVETTPSCDPSYPDVCIAPYPPDLDCDEIGYSNFRVVGYDSHGFDTDYDGIGCEVGSPQSTAEQPATESCDPSYPDVCIPVYPPDLDCGEIPYSNFRVVGDDPHRFDGDKDGIGCES